MNRCSRSFVALLVMTLVGGLGQAPASACKVSTVVADRNLANVFNPEQEVALGEVLAGVVQESREVDDPELAAYLQQMGDGLAKNLPATGLQLRFYLSNTPEANAFSIAGGRVYVTRKLIGYVHSEDELAGVLAHELGHIVTHQSAIDYTRFLKAIGIDAVGDRADIEAKFHKLLESGKRFEIKEEDRQLQADRVGMELAALAGYHTEALADFLDRLSNNQGKTGSWFSEMFGTTPESSKRLREMQKTLRSFPAECVQKGSRNGAEFLEWQAKVVGYSGTGRIEKVPGLLTKKSLEPPLQDEVHTLRFSYDGKYLLAQDDASIYVLTREPLAFKFRIEAPEAYPANFTLDSKRITFYNPDLHVETWDAEAGSRSEVREVVSSHGCMQTALSPDGKTLACVDLKETLVLLDTATEERIFEKKEIRQGSAGFALGLGSALLSYEIRFLNMGFSLDGRYLVVAGKDLAMAIDVPARQEIPLSGGLKPYLQGAFSFIGDRTLVGNDTGRAKAAVLSFPEGKVQHEIELGAAAPFRVAKGDYVLMRPIRDYAVGVLDTRTNAIVRANKTPAIDVYQDTAVSMLGSGEIGLFGAAAAPTAKVALPRGHFGSLRVASISDDLNWLAVSTRARGAVWNLGSQSRTYNLKGFRGACFPKDGNLYVDFPKSGTVDRSIIRAGLRQTGMTLAEKVGRGKAWEDSGYLMRLKGKDDDQELPKDATKDPAKDKSDDDEDKRDYRFEGNSITWRSVFEEADTGKTFEVRDVLTGNLMWSRTFNKVVPAIYTDALANTAAFRWRLRADGARAEAKSLPSLLQTGDGRDEDYLVEIVELSTGKFVNAIILDTSKGAFGIRRHLVSRDWLVAYDSFGRTLVYSLKTGKCVDKFFGRVRNMSPAGMLVVEHGPGRVTLYTPEAAERTHDLVFPFPLSSTFFAPDSKKLVLLTNDQVLYTVDPSVAK